MPCDVPFGAKEPKFQLNQLVQKTWFGKTFRGKIIKYNGYLSENRREVDVDKRRYHFYQVYFSDGDEKDLREDQFQPAKMTSEEAAANAYLNIGEVQSLDF